MSWLLPSVAYTQKAELITRGHGVIWGMVFLDDESLLFTERQGSLKVLDLKAKKIQKIQARIDARQGSQAGLMDVTLDPDFTENHKIYFTYSKSIAGKHTTTLAVAELRESSNKQWQLANIQDLFIARPYGTKGIHYGSRIVVTKNEIWMTVGDRGNDPLAQDLNAHMGKVLRLSKQGKALADNPFVSQKGAAPEVWSYGHRNPQGLIKHPLSGEIWLHEHGPQGGDEINLVKKGANYGWPMVSYGREYGGHLSVTVRQKKGSKTPFISSHLPLPRAVLLITKGAESQLSKILFCSAH